MSKGKNRIKPKDKDVVREAADIVRNSESDELALAFLQDTLEDDFPDLDLARMDLHEAIKGLGGKQEGKPPKGSKSVIEDLNKSLGDFIEIQAKKLEDANRKKANTKKRTKSKKSAKTTKKAKTTKSAKSTKRATAKKSKKK